jgi:hypothetical protein
MKTSNNKIQKIEIDTSKYPLHCPVCGQRILSGIESVEPIIAPCKHTLFIAHDEGFEYRSSLYDKISHIEGVKSEQIHIGDQGYDSFTDSLLFKNTLKYAFYESAPSFFGTYVGFIFEE